MKEYDTKNDDAYKEILAIEETLVFFLIARCVPGETLLVKLDYGLGTLDVGLSCWYKISLIAALPLD